MATNPAGALPSWPYIITSGLFVVAAAVASAVVYRDPPAVTQTPVEGIAVFAALYVVAQAVERVVEIVFGFVDFIIGKITGATARQRTLNARVALRAALQAGGGQAAAATDVAEAKSDTSLLKYCVSFAFSLPFATYIQFSVTKLIGLEGVAIWVDILITAAAITGGGAALHDLIGKVQASKEKDKLETA